MSSWSWLKREILRWFLGGRPCSIAEPSGPGATWRRGVRSFGIGSEVADGLREGGEGSENPDEGGSAKDDGGSGGSSSV